MHPQQEVAADAGMVSSSKLRWPANCQSRGPGLLDNPLMVPKDAEPEAQLAAGPLKLTWFHTLMQSALKVNSKPSRMGTLRRRPASMSHDWGLRNP